MVETFKKDDLGIVFELFIGEMRGFISRIMRDYYGDRWTSKFCDSLEINQKSIWKKNVRSGHSPMMHIDYLHLRPFASNNRNILFPYFDKDAYDLPTWFNEIYVVRNHIAHYKLGELHEDRITKALINMRLITGILKMEDLEKKIQETLNHKINNAVIKAQKTSTKTNVVPNNTETKSILKSPRVVTSTPLTLEESSPRFQKLLASNFKEGCPQDILESIAHKVLISYPLTGAESYIYCFPQFRVRIDEIQETMKGGNPIKNHSDWKHQASNTASSNIPEITESSSRFQKRPTSNFKDSCPKEVLELIVRRLADGLEFTSAEKIIFTKHGLWGKIENIRQIIQEERDMIKKLNAHNGYLRRVEIITAALAGEKRKGLL